MILSDVSIKRPVFTTMVIAAIMVFGIVSYTRIGVDMFPDVEFPVATIVTIYPGADPETVEKEVSEKIEEAVSTLNGVRQLRSISAENVSQVILMFELEIDGEQAIQDVRDKISRILPELPEEVEMPKIEKFDAGAAPILTLAVSGPGRIDEITLFARKKVKEQIQQIPGVGSVDIVGGQEREIRVWIDPDKLEMKSLAVTDIVQALAANNLKIPGGRLENSGTEYVVKVDGEFGSIEEIERLPIVEVMGMTVRLGDVATIQDGLEERRTSARLDKDRAVTLVVRKQSGTNAVQVAERTRERLDELQAMFPEGWKVMVASDATLFTKTSIEHVQFDMVFGALLAVVIIFFFLRNGRSTFISALAIPTSIVGTFIFINVMGFTFNMMTLLALSLSVGILIDDAIVVLENIYRHMEEGASPMQAAKEATGEIGLAVLATTFSIIAVFIPVAFMEGIIGRFFYEFGLTVAVAVMISLFVSFTLTPMLSSRILAEGGSNRFYNMIERLLNAIDHGYRGIIAWALGHRKSTVAAAFGIFILSLYMVTFVGGEFVPEVDKGEFNVYIELPTGTALEKTEALASSIADDIREYPYVLSTIVSIGSDPQKKQNLGRVYVKMRDKNHRSISQFDFISQLRKEFADVPEATISIEKIDDMGGDSGFRQALIQYNLRGGDLQELDMYANRVIDKLKTIPGFVDLSTTYESGKPEVRVNVQRDRAAKLGVYTASIGQSVRALVGGVTASKFKDDGEDYDIVVQLAQTDRRRAEQLSNLKVRSSSGELIALSNVADISETTGPTQIDRENRQRQVTILGNLEANLPLAEAMEIINKTADEIVPAQIVRDYEGQAKFMRESFGHMLFSLMLAIILVYMVLASQFESFIHPFTIMLSLPLSLVGAIGGLLISGDTLNIISMIGVIMLMGLVTKNAILLVDYTNTLRHRDGMGRDAALLKAGPVRLRPILMTTGAMVFGMLPVALSQGFGSEQRSPMAVAVIGGLIASMLLTLVVVPVVYTILDDFGNHPLWKKLFSVVMPEQKAAHSPGGGEPQTAQKQE